MTPAVILGEFELIVLSAVLQLDDDAGTRRIREYLEENTHRSISRGALYTTLDRLEQKGLVRSAMAEGGAERGGRPRRFYRVSPAGLRAVRESRAALLAVWRGLDSRLA